MRRPVPGRGLPARAGVWAAAHGREGVGIDRLVMLLTDSASIRDVILFRCCARGAARGIAVEPAASAISRE